MKSFIWTLTCPTRDYLEELTEKVADIPELRLITALENPDGETEECRMTFSKELSAEELVNFGALLGIFDVEYMKKIKVQQKDKVENLVKNILIPFLRDLDKVIEQDLKDVLEGKPAAEENIFGERIPHEKEEKAISEEEGEDSAPDNQEEEEDLAPIFQMHVIDISDIDGEMSFSAKEVTPENVDEMPESQVRILLKDLLKNYKK